MSTLCCSTYSPRNGGLLSGKSKRKPVRGPTFAAVRGQTLHSTGVSDTKLPLQESIRFFTVSCLNSSLRVTAFEDVGAIKSNATQQLIQMHPVDYLRFFHQRNSLCNKLIQAEGYLFRRDQYVMTVNSVMLVWQRQSGCLLMGHRGGTSGFFNPTNGGTMFTSLILLTCYQIGVSVRRCVRVQCWTLKRPFLR
jgi:hypothetical protein